VVVFDEDTPRQLIERVEPDVLVKGEDWREKGVVGREFVEARGGKVVLVKLLPGRSTTKVVEKIRRKR
jgi:bifunctional ADP-heptose synthase (sugar kinase/adenylyltransferase)